MLAGFFRERALSQKSCHRAAVDPQEGRSEAAIWSMVAKAAPTFKSPSRALEPVQREAEFGELRLAGYRGAWSEAGEAHTTPPTARGAALRHDLPANRVVDAAVRGREAAHLP